MTTRVRAAFAPLFLSLLVVVTGMGFTLWWADVVRHNRFYWVIPGDFWSTFRNAHYVAWGSVSWVYSAHTNLVTLPGYAILLAPVARVSSALGLWESSPSVMLPKPHAWLLAGPFVLLSSWVALVGVDRLLTRLAVASRVRVPVLVLVAGATWPSLAIWGHPEDVLAIGFVALALAAICDGKWGIAAWMVGAGISIQLLVILILPVLVAVAGAKRSGPFLLRASLLPGSLAVAVLVPDFHDAWTALTRQPNFPTVDHPTPWVLLSPKLGPHVVSAGPGHIMGIAAAIGCGVVAIFWRDNLWRVTWLCALAMAARCVFESVMDPYYVMPAVVLAVCCTASLPAWRRLGPALAGTGVTVMTFYHLDMWVYWLVMTAILVAIMVLALPPRQLPDGMSTDLTEERGFRRLAENSGSEETSQPALGMLPSPVGASGSSGASWARPPERPATESGCAARGSDNQHSGRIVICTKEM